MRQSFARLTGVPVDSVMRQPHNLELCFETEDLNGFLKKLSRRLDIRRLGDVTEHGRGQRVVRLYDPDGHLIEVREDVGMVVRHFLSFGLTPEQVSARMDVSLEDLKKLLDAQ